MDKKLMSATEHAEAWLGTESKYLKDVYNWLEKLDGMLGHSKKKDDLEIVTKALKGVKQTGRAERRVNKYDNKVERELTKLEKVLRKDPNFRNISQLHEKIKVAARNILKETSLQEGEIKHKLLNIKSLIENGESDEAKKLTESLETEVNQTLSWIHALIVLNEEVEEIAQRVA